MTTQTTVNSGATLKRMSLAVWQASQGVHIGAPSAIPTPKLMPTGLVHAPNVGVRKSSFSTVNDKFVRPADYRGKA